MKKKIIVAVLALAVVLLATPLVSAAPLNEKKNDKFEAFHVDFIANVFTWLAGEHEYSPSMDNVNRLTIDGPESFISYDITVGENTYHQGVDFIYTGHFEYVFYDVTAWLVIPGVIPPYIWPAEDGGARAQHLTVDYQYEFLPASGIEGTIQMRAISNQRGWMAINSLAGTGDLQNVQIKATAEGSEVEGTPLYVATHDGWVTGWPE